MIKMKRILICISLILSVLIIVCACAPKAQSEPTPRPSPSAKVTTLKYSDLYPDETPEPKKYVAYVNASKLNLREEPNSNSEIISLYAFGDIVEVLEINGKWAKVIINETIGYMFDDYLYYIGDKPGLPNLADYILIQGEPSTTKGKNKEETLYNTTQKVWIPVRGGVKYHKNQYCSNMTDPLCVARVVAENEGFTPCTKCY